MVDLETDGVNRLWIATQTKVILLNFQEDATQEGKFNYREIKPPSFAGLAANSIAVQGYEAAWFATNSGIFRLGLAGDTTWTVFNRGNSLLASDEVHDIAVDYGRGVLWAATSAGLSALELSVATGSTAEGNELVVRPNPWYPAREPLLVVSGIPRYSRVLILTVSGEQVRSFRGRHSSNQLIFWDGTNEHGRPCASGVYLIRALAPDGKNLMGKVALIR